MLFYPQQCVCVWVCVFVCVWVCGVQHVTGTWPNSLPFPEPLHAACHFLPELPPVWLLFSRRASGRPLFISCFLCSVFSRTRVPTVPRPLHAFCLSHGTAHNTMNTSGRNYFGLKVAGNRWRKVFFFAERVRQRGELYKHGGGRKCCTTGTKNNGRCGMINSFERFDHLVIILWWIKCWRFRRHLGIFCFSPEMLSNQENGCWKQECHQNEWT